MSNSGINLVEKLKFYKDFPKEGINFIDIMPLMSSKEVFSQVIKELDNVVKSSGIALPEARGFLFGAPLLLTDGCVTNIIPVRKSGKLPFAEGDLTGVEIMKEYGPDKIFYRDSDIAAGNLTGDVFEIAILDDILATGGTAEALALSLNGKTVLKDGIPHKVVVKQFVFLVEIDDLNGRARLEKIAPVNSLIHLND